MRYKYPKTVTVGDTVFAMQYDKTHDEGASFSFPNKDIPAFVNFGLKYHKTNPLSFLNYIIHEFKEIIQIEQSTRMWNRGKDSHEFHYSHSEHSDLCCQLAGIIKLFVV